ncbi:helix-turn-helix domain-containing protein [Acetobacter cerevisiae]|uniref:helix-turn-helix domain-containing protein n=1 Tax=Acetobacter cerevisiae TaxID=178900 RepID=UPI0007837AFB|nr:helix-turn-helix transcriptional regulator [Acetobacter cerevisiae]GBQ10428.1 hypothetical protein AA14362_2548 [Acetobacter cerevisiae DSM 14362]
MKQTMGQRLSALREAKGVNQIDVAEATGLGRTFLSMLEKDKKQGSIASLAALADFYQVSIDYLYRGVLPPDVAPNVHDGAEEAAWVGLWRDMNEPQRRMVLAMIKAAINSNVA